MIPVVRVRTHAKNSSAGCVSGSVVAVTVAPPAAAVVTVVPPVAAVVIVVDPVCAVVTVVDPISAGVTVVPVAGLAVPVTVEVADRGRIEEQRRPQITLEKRQP